MADIKPQPDLHPDEPYFWLRGQDVLAPFALTNYAALLRAAAAGATPRSVAPTATVEESRAVHARRMALIEQAEQVEQQAARMVAWQAEHHVKLPD